MGGLDLGRQSLSHTHPGGLRTLSPLSWFAMETQALKDLLGQVQAGDLSVDQALGFISERDQSSAAFWRVTIYFLHGVASDLAEKPSGASSTPPTRPGGT